MINLIFTNNIIYHMKSQIKKNLLIILIFSVILTRKEINYGYVIVNFFIILDS